MSSEILSTRDVVLDARGTRFDGQGLTRVLLGERMTATGPAGTYDVRVPPPGSPAIRRSTSCPAEDALGNPRPRPCTAGSVKP